MKKIIMIVLALVLVAGGLGGFAYAQTNGHEPMTGEKLVGTGALGSQPLDGNYNGNWTYFRLTNPDGVSEITIKRISIIKHDGTVIYEGPLLWQKVEENEVVQSIPLTEPLKPHETRIINLQWFMPDPEDPAHEWMNGFREARLLPLASYTVEVFWEGSHRKGLPLIGWAYQQHGFLDDAGIPVGVVTGFGTEMVNMEQKLEPEDED